MVLLGYKADIQKMIYLSVLMMCLLSFFGGYILKLKVNEWRKDDLYYEDEKGNRSFLSG